MQNSREGTEGLVELVIEGLSKEQGEEYECAKQDLEEIYRRFKLASFLDDQRDRTTSSDPIREFLENHPSLLPNVAFTLSNVIFAHVFARLDNARRIKQHRELTAVEQLEANELLKMLDSVNKFFKFDACGEKPGAVETRE
jgi:hypothetical protein